MEPQDEQIEETVDSEEFFRQHTRQAVEGQPTNTLTTPLTAKGVAESLLEWAHAHHLFDPLVVSAHSASPPVPPDDAMIETPNDNGLFPAQGNSVYTLRAKQVAGVLFNEHEKSAYILTRKKISETAIKSMPAWKNGISIKYIHFGQAQSGGKTPPSDGLSYRCVNDRYACGSSIHPARYPGAGTIGCLLKNADGKLFGLSANHVSGLANYADEGEKILAPGHLDITPKGRDPFTIGAHVIALPMHHGTPTNVNLAENTDAAVFAIRDSEAVSSSQGGYYDTPTKTVEPLGGMLVEKVGRTTGYTTGRIIGVSPNPVAVGYQLSAVGGNATVYFNDLVMAIGENGAPFSQPGDSGSLVVGQDDKGESVAVGLVIAGTSTGYSLILPIGPILKTLNMTLVNQHNA